MPAARHTCRAPPTPPCAPAPPLTPPAAPAAPPTPPLTPPRAPAPLTPPTPPPRRQRRAGTAARAAPPAPPPATAGPVGVGCVVVPRVLFERITPASGQSKQQDQPARRSDQRSVAGPICVQDLNRPSPSFEERSYILIDDIITRSAVPYPDGRGATYPSVVIQPRMLRIGVQLARASSRIADAALTPADAPDGRRAAATTVRPDPGAGARSAR